jgi:response regulator RpfG family c-di-GMP phosphodiesterase
LSLTLLVENNPKIAEIYRLNLAIYAGLQVTLATSGEAALALLKQQPFMLIITRTIIAGVDTASIITSSLQERKADTPVLVIGHGPSVPGSKLTIPSSLDLKNVVKGAASALGITAATMASKQVEEYFPIEAKLFEWINYPVCPVFSKDAAGAYQQLFAPDHKIELKNFAELSQHGQGNFFVEKLNRLKIVNQISAELMSRLDDADLNPDEQIQAAESNLELLTKKLSTLGINEETLGLAKKGMDSMASNAKRYPQLGSLLKRMLSNEASLLFRHTQIVTYISLHIIKNIDWGTAEQEQKITFVAFFHDIMLDGDEQALIHTPEDFRKSSLDPRAKSLVEKHAQLAAELVHKYPHAPMGSDQIIRQHHGVLNGVGFSENYGANLSPMAMVFIVAEQFTKILLSRENEPLDKTAMIKELREGFTKARFHKIVDLLENISI